jgi:hypothetical protein
MTHLLYLFRWWVISLNAIMLNVLMLIVVALLNMYIRNEEPNLSVYLPNYLPAYLSVRLPVCPSARPSVRPSAYRLVRLFISLSVWPFDFLPNGPQACKPASPPAAYPPSIYTFVHLSMYPPPSLLKSSVPLFVCQSVYILVSVQSVCLSDRLFH